MKPGSPNEVSHSYDESLKYDKNGNIKKLLRNGYQDSDSGQTVTIDNLSYSYTADTNMLSEVSDSTYFTNGFKDGNNPSEDYTYDSKGNMFSDENKDIRRINYNELNLPIYISMGSGAIHYRYDAIGAKVQKTITINGLDSTIDYLWGYQYKDGVLQFFPTAEGYVQDVVDESGADNFNYVYNYTDHLGNIRLSFGKGNGSGLVTVMEENNYYPFGLKHENYNAQEYTYSIPPGLGGKTSPKTIDLEVTDRKEYQYKYQGQERQDELGLNWDSFKWRNYDYAIGRFMGVDPLTEKYNTWSPYAFSGNRVIDSRELEGLEPLTVHKSIDAAADNFGRFYNDNSIRDNQEYGSTFYAVTDKSGSVVGYSYSIAAIGVTGASVTPSPAPAGTTAVSDIHTHAASTANAPIGYNDNHFSGAGTTPAANLASTSGDIGDNNRTGLNGYVATPSGSLQKYDTKTGVITTVATNMPSDSGTGTGAPGAGVSAPSTWSYTMQKGDTLNNIAKQYNTTVQAITSENKITDPNKISAGTTLNITN